MEYVAIRQAFDAAMKPIESDGRAGYNIFWSDMNGIRIGKDKQGKPVLLVPSGSPRMELRDRHLANIRVRHQLQLKLSDDESVGRFSVVECLSQDEAVRDWFLRLLPSLYEQLRRWPPERVLNDEIAKIAELFRLIASSTSVQLAGLWAEMLLIARSLDPRLLLESWHSDVGAKFDFTRSGFNIEVKATEGTERRHRFAAHQVRPIGAVMVASFMLQQADSGASVMSLYAELLAAAGEDLDLQHKVHKIVGSSVGLRIAEAERLRFDIQTALGSLVLVPAEWIPQPSQPFPTGVSDVRFVADLRECAKAESDHLERAAIWTVIGPAVQS